MSLLSTRILSAGSLLALFGLLVQLAFSRRVRRWTGSAIKFGAFGGCVWVLVTCLLSLFIKYLHMRVQDSGPEKPKEKFLHFADDLKSGFTSRFEKEKSHKFGSMIQKAFS